MSVLMLLLLFCLIESDNNVEENKYMQSTSSQADIGS